MMTIGEKIRQLRKNSNMTCFELGKLIGKERKTVHRMETNKSPVNSDCVYVLCDVFAVTPNELFGIPQQKDETENGKKTCPHCGAKINMEAK